jgi:tryptophan-rich sensory protein
MKINYVVIPLLTILVGFIGSSFTASGMQWYRTINLPSWTPPGYVISGAWTVIFILTAVSAIMVWNSMPRDMVFAGIVAIFLLNAVLNMTWSYLFFVRHEIGYSIIEMTFMLLSVLALMILTYRTLPIASLLLLPYFLWVSFAAYLTVSIYNLNHA